MFFYFYFAVPFSCNVLDLPLRRSIKVLIVETKTIGSFHSLILLIYNITLNQTDSAKKNIDQKTYCFTKCVSVLIINLRLNQFKAPFQLWVVLKMKQCCKSVKEVNSNKTDWAQKRDEPDESHVGIFRYEIILTHVFHIIVFLLLFFCIFP